MRRETLAQALRRHRRNGTPFQPPYRDPEDEPLPPVYVHPDPSRVTPEGWTLRTDLPPVEDERREAA